MVKSESPPAPAVSLSSRMDGLQFEPAQIVAFSTQADRFRQKWAIAIYDKGIPIASRLGGSLQ